MARGKTPLSTASLKEIRCNCGYVQFVRRELRGKLACPSCEEARPIGPAPAPTNRAQVKPRAPEERNDS